MDTISKYSLFGMKGWIGYAKTRFLVEIPVFPRIPVLVYKKPDNYVQIPLPVNKNWNCDLEIPVLVDKNQFWFRFLKTPIRP